MSKTKSNHFLTVVILFSVSIISPLRGQGGVGILETYIQEGLQNSLALKQENLELEKALESINQARALFYPRVTFAPTYSLAAGGRRLQFPVGDLLNPVYSTLNQITKTSAFPQISNVDELLAPNNFHDTKVAFQYAIYDPQIKYNYLIQKQMIGIQEAKKKVVENELRHQIEAAYYQYLQTGQALKVYDNARQTLAELVRLNQKLVNNNVLTKDVVYAADYEVSKLNQQVMVMKKNRNVAQSYFNFLINRDFNAAIMEDSLLVKTARAVPSSLSSLAATALQTRQELTQLDKSLEVAKSAVVLQQQAAKKPSVFVGGNAGFQGFGYTFQNQAYLITQFGLSWDLFKGYERKSKIQQAKIQTELLKVKKSEVERQIEMQVTQAFLELQAARESLQLYADAQTKAEAYFKVIESRYRNGNVLFIEWLKAQNEVTSAQLQATLAQYDVLMKQSMLEKVVAQ